MFTQAELDQAGRLARAMASDIAIYNQEKIRKGLETDRLFEELEDDRERNDHFLATGEWLE